ncbi:MAG: tRNA pseudouridine(38-40) synthase TruA [Gammaproteobacteria bacterium]|nr:tRNA pseudouridine(38-40) synthase TruA [Gammaproteobacteria bacterium]
MRIALGLEYDGTEFCGWQTQHEVSTVQQHVEAALTQIAAHPIQVSCAGRTDAGVHACAQVIHFDTTALRSLRSWVLGSNANLPRAISTLWALEVGPDFHARFSATARIYRYVILNRPTRAGLWASKVSWDCESLNTDAMRIAAQTLLGEHDFSSFRAAGCQAKSPVRHLSHLSITRHHDFLFVDVEANAFLQHMVRNIVGVLLEIGHGERPIEWAQEVLLMRDRTKAGVTAPPTGLYLVGVRYPDRFFLPNPLQHLPFAATTEAWPSTSVHSNRGMSLKG